MKVKVYDKLRQRDEIGYRGHWVVSTERGLTLGAKHIIEEQAHSCNLLELSKVREWLGTDYAIEIII